MKHAVWIAVLSLAGALAAHAQAPDKRSSTVTPAGAAPSTQYVWVTINGAPTNQNSIAIRNIDGTPVLNALGAPVYLTGNGLNAPFDIVSVPSLRRVFVSNQNAPTVSVFNGDTLGAIGVITLPTATAVRGMSLSEDESALFVAGADGAGPAVWRIDPSTLSPGAGPIGGVADATHIAEDCVVIRAANVGGTGNGPGKVYFSVQASGTLAPAPGYIGVIHLNPAAAFTSIQTQVGALATVGTPILMERTPDHRFVFVGCQKVIGVDPPGPPYTVRIIRIDTSNDAATAPQFATAIQDLAHRVIDVSWRTDAGGNNRGFVMVSIDSGTAQVFEIFDTGAAQPVAPFLATTGGLTTPLTIRFAPLSEQVFIGDSIGTQNGYAAWNAKVQPLTLMNSPIGVGSRCLNMAVVAAPSAVVTDIIPRAGLAAPSLPVTVRGAGFTAGSVADIAGTPVTTTFLDSTTLLVDAGGAGASQVGIRVTNPNFQAGVIDLFFRRYTPEIRTPFTVSLPSLAQGYRMLSMPQYATLTSLKAAFSAALGPYNPVVYRVFFYRGGRYVELNALADDGCDLAGESFWVLTRNGGTLTMSEPGVMQNAGGFSRVIPLAPGFNMFSLPMTNAGGLTGSITWGNVLVTTDQTNFGTATSVTPGTIVGPALEYNGSGYVVADPLVAGRGYWVQNITTVPAYLVYSTTAVFKPGAASQAAGSPPPAGMNPPPPPGSSLGGAEASSGGGCGLLGLETVLLAFLGRRIRRRLAA